MWYLNKKRKILNFKDIELDESCEIEVIDSLYELNLEEIEKINSKKPILISGGPGSGKSFLINKILNEAEKKSSDNITYINCKHFLDSINEQKEDYFKVFMTKVVDKIKGKKPAMHEYTNNTFWVINFWSVIELFLATSIITLLTSEIKPLPIYFWILFSLAFGIITYFWIKSLFKVKHWNNYIKRLKRSFLFSSFFKNKKEIIIFDEINRLVIPFGQSLQHIEKKFIKEISSLSSEKLTFIFITSEKIIEEPDENEKDFIHKNFSKVYKLEKNEKIFDEILFQNIDRNFLSKNDYLIIKKFFNFINYRDAKLCIDRINKNLLLASEFNFNDQAIILMSTIKTMNYFTKELTYLNTILKSGKEFINQEDLQYLAEIFYDELSYRFTEWETVKREWDNYKGNKNSYSIFQSHDLLISLMKQYEISNDDSIKIRIMKIYSFLNSSGEILFNNWPMTSDILSEIDFSDETKDEQFSLKKGYSHKLYYNMHKTIKYFSENDINKIWFFEKSNDSYWIKIWIAYKILNSKDKNTELRNILVFCEKVQQMHLYEYCMSIYFRIKWNYLCNDFNFFDLIRKDSYLNFGPTEWTKHYLNKIKNSEIILDNNKEELQFIILICNQNIRSFDFHNLNWTIIYFIEDEKEVIKFLKYLKEYFLNVNTLKKQLNIDFDERIKNIQNSTYPPIGEKENEIMKIQKRRNLVEKYL